MELFFLITLLLGLVAYFALGNSSPRVEPRRGVSCPRCSAAPPVGDHWVCDPSCGRVFDTFAHHGVCPGCKKAWAQTMCNGCQRWSPHAEFYPDQRQTWARPLGGVSQCPYCREDVPAGRSVVCPDCRAPQHQACWDEHGACTSCPSTRRPAR